MGRSCQFQTNKQTKTDKLLLQGFERQSTHWQIAYDTIIMDIMNIVVVKLPIMRPAGCLPGSGDEAETRQFVREAWFVATLIGAVGTLVWVALCVVSILLYRRCRACKLAQKNAAAAATTRSKSGSLSSNTLICQCFYCSRGMCYHFSYIVF